MTVIEHETSPEIATEIARTGRFFAGPILGDSGMNARIVNYNAGQYNPDQAENRGALMSFDWGGPIGSNIHISGFPPDELQDHFPHRALVPVGTTKHLRLVGIKLINGASWEQAVTEPNLKLGSVCEWLVSRLPGWEKREANRIEQEMKSIIKLQPSIKILFPAHCIYKAIVKTQYPNHVWPN